MPEAEPPDETARRLARARALTEIGRYQEAAAVIEGALAESPEDPEALQLLTYSYLELEDLERALPCADRCVAASPADGVGHRYRASILAEQGRLEEARRSALAAVELAPEDVWAHYVLVDVCVRSAHAAEAREAARHLLGLAPEWSSSHESMGRVALLEKSHEDAEAHFKKALEIDPESSVAMNNLGATLLETRKHGEAVRFFWNALRSHSRSSTVQHNLRRALVGHFAHSPFLLGAVAAPPLLLIGLKTGVVQDEHRAFQVFWMCSLALGTAWIGVQIFRHRSLPLGVRSYLWRAVHLPFWAGLRDLVVFCGIVSSVFHGIYLYLWWSRGSHWAPGSPLTWSVFAAFTLWIVACYLQVVSEWLRRRRRR